MATAFAPVGFATIGFAPTRGYVILNRYWLIRQILPIGSIFF
jgi:hypothetical protein